MEKKYPEISQLLKLKAARRSRLASLTFEEKIAIVNKWRRLTRAIRKIGIDKAPLTPK